MDTDSDGQISVAELIAWVKKNSEQVGSISCTVRVSETLAVALLSNLIFGSGEKIYFSGFVVRGEKICVHENVTMMSYRKKRLDGIRTSFAASVARG